MPLAPRARRRPHVVTVNDALPGTTRSGSPAPTSLHARAGARARLAAPPRVLVPSRAHARAAAGRGAGRAARARSRVTPYGVDPRFSPGPGPGAAARRPVPARGGDAAAAQEPRSGADRLRAPRRPTGPRAPPRRRGRARLARRRAAGAAARLAGGGAHRACRAGSPTTSSSRSIAAPRACSSPRARRASASRRWRRWRAGRRSCAAAAGSLPEVLGDAAPLVAPDDHAALAAAVAGVLADPGAVAGARPRARRPVHLGALRGADGGGLPPGGRALIAPAQACGPRRPLRCSSARVGPAQTASPSPRSVRVGPRWAFVRRSAPRPATLNPWSPRAPSQR